MRKYEKGDVHGLGIALGITLDLLSGHALRALLCIFLLVLFAGMKPFIQSEIRRALSRRGD